MKEKLFSYLKRKPTLGILFIFELLILISIGLMALVFFIELTEEVIYEESSIIKIDDYMLELISNHRSPILDEVMISITHFADWEVIVTISTILFLLMLWKQYYYLAIEQVLITAGSIYTNAYLKDFFNRPRPNAKHIVEVVSSSYPSGHAMVGFAVYGFMIFIIWKLIKNNPIRISAFIILFILILLIGFSRMYLQVHYLSDVAGGFAAGLFWLVLCVGIVNVSSFLLKKILIQ